MRLVVIGLLVAAGAAQAQSRVLKAGAYETDITPPAAPIIVSGGFLARAAATIDAPLKARALVLDDGSRRIVIALADSLMMPRELLDEVKAGAARLTGIPTSHMLVAATHTHSAPPVMGALGTDANPEYAAQVKAQLVRAIEGAAGRLQPARLGWITTPVPELTHCRRWILRPDKVRADPFGNLTVRANMHPGYQNPEFTSPSGPTDPELSLLAVETAAGKPLALLANYSMHYVGSDRGVSPDYFGWFCANMRQALGVAEGDPGFVAMMSQGTSGDQHWMDYGRPKQEWKNAPYAEALARRAAGAYAKIRFRDWAPVDIRETRLTLERRTPDALRLKWAREIYAAIPEGKPRNQVEVYAREQILLHAEPRRELILQAARIGELGIAAWPNEVFALSGLKVKAQSPLETTFNIELANGAEGYIPPPEQHLLGGYTTWPARTAGLEVSAEPRIVEALLGLLEAVSGKRRRAIAETPGVYARAVLATRPWAYWRGDEMAGSAAVDSSRKGRVGRYVGAVARYLNGVGEGGRAPYYAGGYLDAPAPQGERYALAAWFAGGIAEAGVVFSRGADSVSIGGAGGRVGFSDGERGYEGTARIEANRWYFLVVNRERGMVRVYLDGKLEFESAAAPPARVATFRLGGGQKDEGSFEGRIDEVAVFDRTLAEGEIAKLAAR